MPRIKGNSHVLLCGMAVFMWDREKISNEEILRCVYAFVYSCTEGIVYWGKPERVLR